MATLALAAIIPSGFWGEALLAKGAAYALTTYIDSRFVLPALFPQPDAPRPKIGDLDFQFAEEGAIAPYVLGQTAPCKGGLIWMSDVIPVAIHNYGGGGCGGGGAQIVGYRYYAHVQVLVTECDPVTGISDVKRVWKNGKIFYERDSNVAISSTLISAVIYYEVLRSGGVSAASNTTPIRMRAGLYVGVSDRVRVSGVLGNTGANGDWVAGGVVTSSPVLSEFDLLPGSAGTGAYTYPTGVCGVISPFMELRSTSSGPDLTALRTGIDATVAGFTASANNGTFKVMSTGQITGGGTFARFENHNSVAESAGNTITITQTVPPWNLKDAVDVHFTDGSATEVPDPLVESIEGAGNVPAYRGRATMVVEFLLLDGPGQMPEFKFLVEEAAPATTRAASIGKIMKRAGYEADEYETAEVTGAMLGVGITGGGTSNDALQPLSIAFDILAQQRDSVIRFFDRLNATVRAVEEDDLGAHDSSDTPIGRLSIVDPPDDSMADEATFQHFDPALDYQTGSQRERKNRAIPGREVMQITAPVVMSAQQGRGTVRRALWMSWSQRQKLSFSLPPSYCFLREGDVITTTVAGEPWRILLRRVDLGANYIVNCEGEVDDPVISSIVTGPADPPGGQGPPPITVPGQTALVIANLAPLVTAQVNKAGFYYQTCLEDENEHFVSIALWDSIDDITFNILDDAPAEGTMGVSASVLIGNGVDPHFIDLVNTVDVRLKNGTAASTTMALLLAGANRWLVGNEVLGALTATLVDSNTYRLSGLLRGLHDTQDEMARHLLGERVMLLNDPAMRFIEFSQSQVDVQRYYRSIAAGDVVTVGTTLPHIIDNSGNRHWTPCQPKIQRDSSTSKLVISWKRRCLGPIRIFQGNIPLYDTQEEYEIEIYSDSTFVTLLRTLSASNVSSVDYTSGQQTADFGSAQTVLNLQIYQVHVVGGRSKPLIVQARPFDTAI